ncbi:flagellin [soil metagenome]
MRINTNVSALNASNNLSRVQESSSDSMAKLSSGLRINKSGDDAAGLGIANKLHADTRALTQASRNAEQANSMLSIADGATSTVQKMLERMKELATQSASDNTDGDATTGGRKAIQAEFLSLSNEITRTVSSTKFQGKALLDGTFGASASGTALAAGNGIQSVTLSGASAATYNITNASGVVTITNATTSVSQALTVTAATKQTLNFDKLGISLDTDSSVLAATLAGKTIIVGAGASGGSFMIGSSGSYSGNDVITLNKLDLTLSTLGISGDLTTSANAVTALGQIDTALGKVAVVQGDVGAAQNRIAYAQDNLKTTIQNYSAAESVIRDVDMADEMSKFTKNNILAQAGTAMLAQANQQGQGVLKLLQ